MADSVERYCPIAANGIPATALSVFVVDRTAGHASLVDRKAARLFFECSGFRTLASHASDCSNRLEAGANGPVRPDAVLGVLQSFVLNGLFVSEGEWLDRVASGAAPGNRHDQIGTVAVVTRDGPDYVRRCLESVAKNLAASGRRCRICVYDDSAASETFEVVAAFRRCAFPAGSLVYCGPRQRALYLKQLRETGEIPPEVVNFGLGDSGGGLPAYGVNMNWMLLDTAGTLAACMDDDVLCTPGLRPGCSEGLNISSAANVGDIRVMGDRDEAFLSVIFDSAEDFLSLHEQLLGRSVADCIREYVSGGLNLTDMSPSFMDGLRSEGSVRVTMMGIAGESGTSQDWIGMRGKPRERLWERARLTPSILDSHEVVRVPSQLTIADFPWFMNYACGLDNRTLLPPFLPVCRNMDGVFAVTMRCCFPGAFVGHIPWVVAHDPPARDWRLQAGHEPRLSEVLMAAIASFQIERNSADPAANLRAVGQRLTHIGTLPGGDFEKWLRRHYFQHLIEGLKRAESACREADSSGISVLKEHCRRHVNELENALSCVEDISARDLREGKTPEESLRATQVAIRRFGELLVWWPAIVELSAAKQAAGAAISDCGE